MNRVSAGTSSIAAGSARLVDRLTTWSSSVAAKIFGGALVVALVLSTRLLAQPFVWENFAVPVIAEAWACVFRDRLVVTWSIALAIVGVRRLATRGTGGEAVAIAVAIAAGALLGEWALLALGFESDIDGLIAFLPRVVRWCVIASIVATMFLLYGRVGRARAATQDATMKAAQFERQAVESRLQLLRAQIEPHFLFNTLATIRQLHRSTHASGASMLSNFIDYLQATIPKSRAGVRTLRDEVDLVRAYLGLVEVRMSGLLATSIDVDRSVEDHAFPPMSVATLVENAVKHGILPSKTGGHIAVVARRVGDWIEVTVSDTGVGLSAKTSGSGIGLANTRARLMTMHGPGASLSLSRQQPTGVRATIRIPS